MSSAARQSDRSATRANQRNQRSNPYGKTGKGSASGERPWLGWLEKLNPASWLGWSNEPIEAAAERLMLRGEELAHSTVENAQETPQGDGDVRQPQEQSNHPPPPPPVAPCREQPPSQTQEATATQEARMDTDAPEDPESEIPETTKQKLEAVKKFLAEKHNTRLNLVELKGITALLRECTDGEELEEDKPEPFRFSFSSSPSMTPAPEAAPTVDFTAPGTGPAPRRMLNKNPNGTYRINGAGSARPRQRYTHPGFPAPRRPATAFPTSPEKPKTDGKRRRMEPSPLPQPASAAASATSTSAAPPTPGPAPTSPQLNGTSPRPRPSVATSVPAKPTTPARPSPLRQTWGEPASPPQSKTSPKSTASANYLNSIIDKVTPPKKAEIANPYEALGFGRRATRRPPAKKGKEKAALEPEPERVASTSQTQPRPQQPAPEKAKEAKPSARIVIEATVPTGSKRARPPAEIQTSKPQGFSSVSPLGAAPARTSSTPLAKNGASPTRNGKRVTSVIVEEVSDEEDNTPAKRQRTNGAQANGRPNRPTVTVEEIDDPDLPLASRTTPSPSYARPSEVIEPQDDRGSRSRSTSPISPATSFGNLTSSSSSGSNLSSRPTFGNLKSSAPKVPSKLRYSAKLEEDEREKEAGADSLKESERREAKAAAVERTPPVPSPTSAPAPAPAPVLAPAPVSAPAPVLAAAPGPARVSPLAPAAEIIPSPKSGKPKLQDARASALALPKHALPMFAFDLRTSSPGAGPSTYRDQASKAALSVVTSDIPTYNFTVVPAAPKPATSGFDWATAGMKPPPKPAGDTWTCTMCSLSSPASATEKCTVCEAPKPGAKKAEPAMGFNWAAAGVKPPPKPAGDEWTCTMCCLVNPADAREECKFCEARKPGSDKPKAAVRGFDWAAAGMAKPVTPADTWACSMCGLSNAEDASKCYVCDTPR